MEANKYTVQEGTSAMEAATKDKKLGLDELRALNSKNVKSMTEWVEREKKAIAAPARRPNDDSHEADVQYMVDMNAHKEFKGVLDSFDAQIAALKEAYANSKEELKSATSEEISKFEASIGIAPEKKDLFAGISPGDKIDVSLNDGNGETTKAVGTFSKVENGKLFMKINGKEYDIGPVSSVKSIKKSDAAPAGEKAAAAPAKQQASEPAKADKGPSAPEAKSKNEHVIARGETLSGIAKQYGVSVSELASANGIEDANKISVGKKLSIPEGGAAKESVAKRPQVSKKSAKESPAAQPKQNGSTQADEPKKEEPKKEGESKEKQQKADSGKYGTEVPGAGGLRADSPIARMNAVQKEDPKGGRTNLEFIASGDAGKGNVLPGTKKA